MKAAIQSSSASHFDTAISFFQKAVENKHFIIVCIDDYHNIHTKHRPAAKTQTEAVHMSTLLVKVFPNVKAVPMEGLQSPLLTTLRVETEYLFKLVNSNMAGLSQSYATTMPDWVIAKYFDQKAERHRLILHDYQQTEIQKMRCMENTKLVDSLHLPLKSSEDPLTILKHMLKSGLEIYLSNFSSIHGGLAYSIFHAATGL